MSLYSVIQTLNRLKQKHVVSDWAIMGGYAVNYYIEPTYTHDVDILVAVKDDSGYHELYSHLVSQGHKTEGLHIVIGGTPVQFFPNYISSLYNEAIQQAKRITFRALSAKVISAEYLVALLLSSYRPKDKVRIIELVKVANIAVLDEVLARYEDQKAPLRERLRRLLERD